MEMYAGGPSWSNVLFKDIIPETIPYTHFLWDFWVYHDPAAEAHFWSSELDFYVVLVRQRVYGRQPVRLWRRLLGNLG